MAGRVQRRAHRAGHHRRLARNFNVPREFVERAANGDLPCRSASVLPFSIACCGGFARAEPDDASPRIRTSAASRRWRKRSAATSTRCAPSSASGKWRGDDERYRRLVRAIDISSSSAMRISSSALRRHALDDPHALSPRAHWDGETLSHRTGRRQERSAARRRRRGAVADLFPQHLQPRAAEGEGDAGRDAEEILAEPSGGLAHS